MSQVSENVAPQRFVIRLRGVRHSADEPTATQMLFTLIDRRVGRTFTILTSNIKPSAWGTYLGAPALTMAMLDRIDIEGPSWRDKESKERNLRHRTRPRKTAEPI